MNAHTPDDKYQWVGAIHTNSGTTFDIINPTVDMIDIADIAHALAMQCRYNGHVPSFYSVAEHSVRVSDWLYENGYPDYAFAGLMHDASESYIGDIVRPMKQLPEFGSLYKEFEAKIELIIGERFNVELYPMSPIVAAADKAVYEWEVEEIRSGNEEGLAWNKSEAEFIERFNRYCLTRDIHDFTWEEARSRAMKNHPSFQGVLDKIINMNINRIEDEKEEELESQDDGLLYADVAEDGTICPNVIEYGTNPDTWPRENPAVINYNGPAISEDAIEKFRELFNRGIRSVAEEFGDGLKIQGNVVDNGYYTEQIRDGLFDVEELPLGGQLIIDDEVLQIRKGEEIRIINDKTGGEKGSKLARFDLIPVGPLTLLAEHYGRGAQKYDANNWRRAYDWSLSYAALQRHLTAWWGGEDNDPELGNSHMVAVAWHAFALLEFIQTHPELDDRFSTRGF